MVEASMLQDVEMTEVNLEPEGMIVDSKPNSIFIKKLPSKLCISLVMSYAFTFEKMEQVFRGLSKKAQGTSKIISPTFDIFYSTETSNALLSSLGPPNVNLFAHLRA